MTPVCPVDSAAAGFSLVCEDVGGGGAFVESCSLLSEDGLVYVPKYSVDVTVRNGVISVPSSCFGMLRLCLFEGCLIARRGAVACERGVRACCRCELSICSE